MANRVAVWERKRRSVLFEQVLLCFLLIPITVLAIRATLLFAMLPLGMLTLYGYTRRNRTLTGLVDLPGSTEQYGVEAWLRCESDVYGMDEGVLTMSDGWLYFRGNATTFWIKESDLSVGRDGWVRGSGDFISLSIKFRCVLIFDSVSIRKRSIQEALDARLTRLNRPSFPPEGDACWPPLDRNLPPFSILAIGGLMSLALLCAVQSVDTVFWWIFAILASIAYVIITRRVVRARRSRMRLLANFDHEARPLSSRLEPSSPHQPAQNRDSSLIGRTPGGIEAGSASIHSTSNEPE